MANWLWGCIARAGECTASRAPQRIDGWWLRMCLNAQRRAPRRECKVIASNVEAIHGWLERYRVQQLTRESRCGCCQSMPRRDLRTMIRREREGTRLKVAGASPGPLAMGVQGVLEPRHQNCHARHWTEVALRLRPALPRPFFIAHHLYRGDVRSPPVAWAMAG